MLSTTQVAEELGIVSSTVRVWGTELAAVLSPEANPPRGHKRLYTEEDVAIFRTARTLRADGHSWEEVVESIRAKAEDGSPPDEELAEKKEDAASMNEAAELAKEIVGDIGDDEEAWPDNSDEVVPGTIFDLVMRQISARTDDLRADLEDEREQHEATRERLRDAELRATAAEIEVKMLKAQLDEFKEIAASSTPWWQVWRRREGS